MKKPRGAGRGVLEGVFGLLDELARAGEAGPTELAAATGVPKATVHRLLVQLVELGAVQRSAGRYRIGPRMVGLGQAWRPDPVLRAAAEEPLRALASAVRGERISVAVAEPHAGRTLIVGAIRGDADDVLPLRAGTLLPYGCAGDRMHATALPHLPEPPQTHSAREWKQLVADAKGRGLAVDHATDLDLPVSCMAAPIRNSLGEVVATLGAVVLDQRNLSTLSDPLRRAAALVGARLVMNPSV
ncbi:IclR family transcriptional regulator [Amycolatopsis regifaucium]|uniref:IclR family transcriptional regulator n=1 Tax=Amycolatopsis regifaucium TaxID=546365 RepID=UPI0008F63C79|nr:helix-turn-helix domain-containing protein [Amycolatopsis regifaucium]SFI65543.1 DNA-binding transcriptional regulator, IclR family [Amycolatopsis regifaucium]